MTIQKMELQVKAIEKKIKIGKANNVYAAFQKIDKINTEIRSAKEKERINKWLSQ